MNEQISGRGVGLSLTASILFGILPIYVQYLDPLDGLQILAQRILWSLPVCVLLIYLFKTYPLFAQTCRRFKSEPILLLYLVITSLLLASQWFLFLWAPLIGKTLDVSLGYFLLPLVLVIVGRFFYGENLRLLQFLAVICAAIGVTHEVISTWHFSWITLACLGYVPYLMLRRKMQLDSLTGLILEMLILSPICILVIAKYSPPNLFSHNSNLYFLLPLLGLLGAVAFAAMMGASRLLSMSLFGILSYVEPALLFVIALLFLDENFNLSQVFTYIPIWLALILIGADSLLILRRQHKN